MARKKKPKPKEGEFAVGDRVRVRPGVTDPDFDDIPLGGWVGVIEEPESGGTIMIRWTKETLRGMPKICKSRSERDGLDYQLMSLYPREVVPDDGSPVVMEQPTAIVPRPLAPEDQGDRIRAALGLTSRDDPIPAVKFETLWAYRAHLQARLPFPFLVTMTDLWELADEFVGEEFLMLRVLQPKKNKVRSGLACEVRRERHPTRKLTPNERNQSFEVPLAVIFVDFTTPQGRVLNDFDAYVSRRGAT